MTVLNRGKFQSAWNFFSMELTSNSYFVKITINAWIRNQNIRFDSTRKKELSRTFLFMRSIQLKLHIPRKSSIHVFFLLLFKISGLQEFYTHALSRPEKKKFGIFCCDEYTSITTINYWNWTSFGRDWYIGVKENKQTRLQAKELPSVFLFTVHSFPISCFQNLNSLVVVSFMETK